ncbi:Fic family protein [Novosphingobium sp. BL-52-GroH]|uniref:Fic family protein n=1 Tax=Novosphingobium sp. BL-52-GroH TaxID=3349877 RepID=UPI00384A757D
MAQNPESPTQIEPARIEALTGDLPDIVAELSARAEVLGKALHPRTAANLADLVRIMNTYYSNLIEGHNNRPRDIERALAGQKDEDRRDLLTEAVAHYRVQEAIDHAAQAGTLPDPADPEFIRALHRDFYADASEAMLTIEGSGHRFVMTPGEWRTGSRQDVQVGRHLPPSSDRVPDFMAYFHSRFAFEPPAGMRLTAVGPGRGKRILAMATSHHRFNWIHPFPDGNGRVSRLMSHAMAQAAGIGAHGLWSVSRGLARGISGDADGRAQYKRLMAHADAPRQGDRDGRGNLSLEGLETFATWFLSVCLDQVTYMSELLDLAALSKRIERHVALEEGLPLKATGSCRKPCCAASSTGARPSGSPAFPNAAPAACSGN